MSHLVLNYGLTSLTIHLYIEKVPVVDGPGEKWRICPQCIATQKREPDFLNQCALWLVSDSARSVWLATHGQPHHRLDRRAYHGAVVLDDCSLGVVPNSPEARVSLPQQPSISAGIHEFPGTACGFSVAIASEACCLCCSWFQPCGLDAESGGVLGVVRNVLGWSWSSLHILYYKSNHNVIIKGSFVEKLRVTGSHIPSQGRPFRSVPGARISVRSGPFRSAAFHVVSESAYKDATCVFCESGNAGESCRWPMSEIFCNIMGREVTKQFLAAF